ncbi:acyl-CoA dehydrogenase family protein [Actinomadura rubrisoli]|uniref:Acyl-CoA dehydrogenase n=1 Tax=Actinomadura rubrisoli TaxID=2530368 RepID=A0A4R5C9H2_9ACTN|nr:acyl-CoA dehydrogenase [Actinomadura rubrisoli]TDD94823.1 acyl-CoA dehydrogenase [Actinomadura rubrisoli]
MELDDDLLKIRDTAREYAADLRERALAVDAAPLDLEPHLRSPGLGLVRDLLGEPRRVRRVTVALLELARGDAGMVLAAPGPALAGVVVGLLGGPAHARRLAEAVRDGRTWAFMAITEPDAGSDAARLQARLRADGDGGYLLSGCKRYIGNGARGGIGVVFARTGTSPLSIRAALVEAPSPGLSAVPLGAVGLRGAGISEMVFVDVPVPGDALLGGHLPATGRGLLGAVKAFNIVRVYVAAMAIGTAAAVHDVVLAEAGPSAALESAEARIDAARRLVLRAAADVEADTGDGYRASVAKLAAVALARKVCDRLPELLGPGALLDHPLLEKWWRDAAALEFMEGTSHIQRLNVAHRRQRGGAAAAREAGVG